MATKANTKRGAAVFKKLCSYLEKNNIEHYKNDEILALRIALEEEGGPSSLILAMDCDVGALRLLIPLPLAMKPQRRLEGAIVCAHANCNISDGVFDYNADDGSVVFRMAAFHRDGAPGEGPFKYMITTAKETVEKYRKVFEDVNSGKIGITDLVFHSK